MRRLTIAVFILYILLTFFPSVSLALQQPFPVFITPISTLTGFTFALLLAGQREGWERALRFLAIVFGISLLFESVGVATGLVYGPCHYTNKLGPLFLGLVPYLIPVAWFMMSYPSFVIADRLVPSAWKNWQRVLGMAAVGGLAMTAWDTIMDPIMFSAGNWIWERGGAYFGIPLQNFWGWWLTVFTTFAMYLWLFRKGSKGVEIGSDWQALVSYLITGLSIIIISLLSGTGGLALIGFFTMMPWVIAAGLKLSSKSHLSYAATEALSPREL